MGKPATRSDDLNALHQEICAYFQFLLGRPLAIAQKGRGRQMRYWIDLPDSTPKLKQAITAMGLTFIPLGRDGSGDVPLPRTMEQSNVTKIMLLLANDPEFQIYKQKMLKDAVGTTGENAPKRTSAHISHESIAAAFEEFLLGKKSLPHGIEGIVRTELAAFIKGHVPEIEAIEKLREAARPVDKTSYPQYADRFNYGIDNPIAWYNRFYRADVENGLVNTSNLSKIDRSFTHFLTEALKPDQTLAQFMELKRKPSARVEALSAILQTTPDQAAQFMHSFSRGGRPPKQQTDGRA